MDKMVPLSKLWQGHFCIGCGACAAVCPQHIIELNFIDKKGFYEAGISPENRNKCVGCGLCLEVCPVILDNAQRTKNDRIPVTLNELYDWLTGPYKEIYTGYSADRELRCECSSGGVATALLMYLFKIDYIDAAVVVSLIPGMLLRHRTCLIEKTGDIVECNDSVYCQVDYSPTWEFIQKSNSRIAIVGLPCQLEAINSFITSKGLDDSRIFKIGLFCGGITSHRVLNYLCKRLNVNQGNIDGVRYRTGGWPGRKMVALVHDINQAGGINEVTLFNRDVSIYQKYLYNFCFSGPFFPKACRICRNQTNEMADISLGDAWLPKFTSSDRVGMNLIIARTPEAEWALKGAVDNGILKLKKAKPDDVVESQGSCLVGRKLGLWGAPFWTWFSNNPEQIMCKKYIPQYVPSIGLLLERRMFQWLVLRVPIHLAFVLFVIFNFVLEINRRFKIIFIKVIRKTM